MNQIFALCFALIVQLSLSFTCSSLSNQTICLAYNCTFSGGICTGTLTPTCTGNCYYVEANAPVSPGVGTLASPFSNISAAFSKISSVQTTNGVYRIIILLKNETEELYLAGSFSYSRIQLYLSSYINILYPAVYIGQLVIQFQISTASFTKVRFSSKSADFQFNKNIIIGSATTFSMNDVLIWDLVADQNDVGQDFLQIGNANPLTLANIQTRNAPAFKATCTNQIILTVNNLTLTDTVYYEKFIDCLCRRADILNLTLSNITQQGAQSDYGLFHLALYNRSLVSGTATLKNVLINNFKGQFFSNQRAAATDPSFFVFSNMTLQNIDLDPQNLLINLEGNTMASITNSTFRNISNALMLLNVKDITTNLTIQDTTFSDITPATLTDLRNHTSTIQSSLIGLCGTFTNTQLILNNVSFYDIYYNCLSLINLDFILQDVTIDYTNSKIEPFPAWLNDDEVGPMITMQDTPSGQIIGSSFVNNRFGGASGAGLYFTGDNIMKISIQQSTFSMLKANKGAAIYSEMSSLSLTIEDSTFNDNEVSDEGGAIFFDPGVWKSSTTVSIKNSYFSGNKAINQGGAISAKNLLLDVQRCSFIANNAPIGGAFYGYGSKTDNSTMMGLYNNLFQANTASNAGAAIRMMIPDTLTDVHGNTYSNNVAVAAPKYSDILISNTVGTKLNIYQVTKYTNKDDITDIHEFVNQMKSANGLALYGTSDNVTSLQINQKTGHSLDYVIEVLILDQDGNVFQAVNGDEIMIYFDESLDYEVRGEAETAFLQGSAYFYNQPTLYGDLHTQRILHIATIDGHLPNLQGILSFDLQITVNFIDCEVGEIYYPDQKACVACEPGWISFGDAYTSSGCQPCAGKNYECLGGNVIAVNQGFWRDNEQSLDVRECPVESACLGGLYDGVYDPQGFCQVGYQGNLCNGCATNYAKTDGGECVNCKDNKWIYVKFVIFSIAQVAFLWFILRSYIIESKGITTEDSNESFVQLRLRNAMMRIFINFAQTFAILSHLDLEWPITFTVIGNTITQIVPSDRQGFPIDCFITLDIYRSYFIKFVILAIRPIILTAITLAIIIKNFLINRKKKWISELKTQIIVSLLCIGFIMQPGIMQNALESFKCQSIGTAQQFMLLDLDLDCSSYSYKSQLGAFVWPLLSVWGIVLPVLLIAITARRKPNKEKQFNSRYFLLFSGLREKHFYWEYWIYFRKSFFTIFTVFSHTIRSDHRVWIITWALVLIFILQTSVKPYENATLNGLESLSLFSLCLIIGAQMFLLEDENTNHTQQIIFVVIATSVLIIFVLRWLWLMIRSYRRAKLHSTMSAKVFAIESKETKTLKITTKTLRKETLDHIQEDENEEKSIYKRSTRLKKISDDLTTIHGELRTRKSTRDLDMLITMDKRVTSAREIVYENEVSTPHSRNPLNSPKDMGF